MKRTQRGVVAAALAAAMFSSGCYGPFYLTRKVWEFNGQVSDNKWIVEVVYLVCTFLPVYGIAGAADAIIFNSIEFWGGQNPMAPGANADTTPKTKRIVRGNTEAVLTHVPGPNGGELVIEQVEDGQVVSSLRMHRDGGQMVASGADGATLFTAETLTDGRVQVRDAGGQQVAMYSKEQAERQLASLRQ